MIKNEPTGSSDPIEIQMDSSTINFSGFSGEPVLNKNNEVIGHITGGQSYGNDKNVILKLFSTPVSALQTISI